MILGLIIFPIIRCFPGDKRKKALRCRLLVHYTFRFFVQEMRFLGVLTYETKGLEGLKDGQLVISNHPSLIDVVFLISFIENANCIVRHGLFKNPFTGGAVTGSGYIPNNEGSELIEDCVKSLQMGDSLVIFPEGTRTPPTQEPRFQRGAANIALAAGIEATPITIKSSISFLTKADKWYDIPLTRPHLCFELGQLEDVPELEPGPKSARALTKIFYKHFFPEK